MSLHSEYRELGLRRGGSSLNHQLGDGDPDESTFIEAPERDTWRGDKRPFAAYLMVSGEGIIEPLVGRLKASSTIKKASVCKSEKSAERLIREWQEAYEAPVQQEP